jgi:hypothetical protein
MNEEINSGLLQDVRDLDPRPLSASATDGTDADQKVDRDRTDGDSDSGKAGDTDGTDAGDTDGTDSGDSDGTDSGDADGTDNA